MAESKIILVLENEVDFEVAENKEYYYTYCFSYYT